MESDKTPPMFLRMLLTEILKACHLFPLILCMSVTYMFLFHCFVSVSLSVATHLFSVSLTTTPFQDTRVRRGLQIIRTLSVNQGTGAKLDRVSYIVFNCQISNISMSIMLK